MIRGFYTAVAGVIANVTRQAVAADNLANANTPGFKESRTAQSDFELELIRSTGGPLGPLATAAVPVGLALDRSMGPLDTTGSPTDLAVSGDGLFVIGTAAGIAFTRAGDFAIDAAGRLTTQAGEPVLDSAGQPIVVPGGASALSVGQDGTVAGTGQRIALVAWPAGGLERAGGTLLVVPSGAPAILPPFGPANGTAATGTILQGELERSNVDLAGAMSELIGYQRSLALNARALSMQDETLGEAVGLGRLR
jgi:flagellar basal body rod protein FlgG